MGSWAGVVLALAGPSDDRMRSRLSVYLHPLAGRPLCWHALRALASQTPRPRELVLVAGPDFPPDLFRDLEQPVRMVPSLSELVAQWPEGDTLLLVDAAVPTLEPLLEPLLLDAEDTTVAAPGRSPGAVRLAAGRARELLRAAAGLPRWTDGIAPGLRRVEDEAAGIVRDRTDFGRAAARVRDQTVAKLMEEGATFLLPETVLVDVDVRIGRDTVIYPGVVLEGQTTIGEETVIGPGSRIVDSWIGSGVEMKGWNYISHTSVRNRAILEPYVRRGFE